MTRQGLIRVGSLMTRLSYAQLPDEGPGNSYAFPLIINRARESRDQRRPTRAANPELFPTCGFSPLPYVRCRKYIYIYIFFFYFSSQRRSSPVRGR